MRISRVIPLSVLSAAVVMAGLTAPSIGQAVVPARAAVASSFQSSSAFQKSSAMPTSAFLRVDGGTAYATKIDRNRYTVRLPKGTDITWLGEAGGKPDQWGAFTPTKLAKAWTRIGHRAGVGVQSTITWRAAGTEYTSFVDARVSDPRINRDGVLVFSARTARGTLPKVLPDFSFNISPATDNPRKYPIVWGPRMMTSRLYFQPQATGDTSGQVTFVYPAGTPVEYESCSPPFYNAPTVSVSSASVPAGSSQANVTYNGFTCNDVTILSGTSTYVAWSPMAPGGRSSMLPCWTLKLSSTQSTAGCSSTTFSWAAGASSQNP